MSAFPPHRSTVSLPITADVALKFLSTYLAATKTSPHLLPNARLEPSGPTSGANTSSVVIHNLLRVEAGLRGEWMAPSVELGEKNTKIAQGMDDGTNTGAGAAEAEGEGWMDLDQYQREQSIEGGEMEDRRPVVRQEGEEEGREEDDADAGVVNQKEGEDEEDAPAPKRAKMKHQDVKKAVVTEKAAQPIDKAQRSKDKKERLKAEKKAKLVMVEQEAREKTRQAEMAN